MSSRYLFSFRRTTSKCTSVSREPAATPRDHDCSFFSPFLLLRFLPPFFLLLPPPFSSRLVVVRNFVLTFNLFYPSILERVERLSSNETSRQDVRAAFYRELSARASLYREIDFASRVSRRRAAGDFFSKWKREINFLNCSLLHLSAMRKWIYIPFRV